MEGFTRVGRAVDFTNRTLKNLSVNGIQVVLLKVDELIYAFENNCPHQHFSVLHQGTVDGCSLTCPMHGWTFDLKTGNALNGNGKLKTLIAKIDGDSVWIATESDAQLFSLFDA